ncbi:MAG: hypothetical protein GY930_04315 [bacterium]|nr:hypothetical protein [bacterium]
MLRGPGTRAQIEQLSSNVQPVNVRKTKGYSPLGGSMATSAVAGSPIIKRIGPWGIQLLNSETLPVFMDLGFLGGPMLRLQPDEGTVAFLLKLSQ